MISLDRFGLSCVRGASLEETLGENSPQPACPQHQRPRCSLGIIGMFWTGRSCRRRQCWPWRKRKRAIGPASAPRATIRTQFARSSPYSLIICDFTGRIKFWPARRLYGTYFRYAGEPFETHSRPLKQRTATWKPLLHWSVHRQRLELAAASVGRRDGRYRVCRLPTASGSTSPSPKALINAWTPRHPVQCPGIITCRPKVRSSATVSAMMPSFG